MGVVADGQRHVLAQRDGDAEVALGVEHGSEAAVVVADGLRDEGDLPDVHRSAVVVDGGTESAVGGRELGGPGGGVREADDALAVVVAGGV